MERGRGYDEGFNLCYREHADLLRRFIFRYVRDADVADDLVQEVFLKLFERGVTLDPRRETTKSFLATVARNTTVDYLRKQCKEQKRRISVELDEVAINARFYKDVENAYIEGEVVSTIHEILDEFPEEIREIFVKKNILRVKLKDVVREGGRSPYRISRMEKEVFQKMKVRLAKIVG